MFHCTTYDAIKAGKVTDVYADPDEGPSVLAVARQVSATGFKISAIAALRRGIWQRRPPGRAIPPGDLRFLGFPDTTGLVRFRLGNDGGQGPAVDWMKTRL